MEYYCVDDKCSWKKQTDYISSWDINIVKKYTREFTGGLKYILNYGYILDAIKEIESSGNKSLKELYHEEGSE